MLRIKINEVYVTIIIILFNFRVKSHLSLSVVVGQRSDNNSKAATSLQEMSSTVKWTSQDRIKSQRVLQLYIYIYIKRSFY